MELADVPDSKSGGGDTVRVRPPPPAPNQYNPNPFPIGDGFGLLLFFERFEDTHFLNGTMLSIDNIAVEDEVAANMYERSEPDHLIYNDPVGYAKRIPVRLDSLGHSIARTAPARNPAALSAPPRRAQFKTMA